MPTYCVEATRWSPDLFSRFCRRGFIWDVENAPAGDSVEFLAEVARRIGRHCILIPGTDGAATFIADHAPVLSQWYIFPDQNPQLVRSMCSKKEMHRLAGQLHVPTPRTIFPDTAADLWRCIVSSELPVIIKGIGGRLKQHTRRTKVVIWTRKEFHDLFDQVDGSSVPNLVVQEYIPGDDDAVWMFNGYFNERHECLMGFTGRKLRQCPAYTGVTSLGICRDNPAVSDIARRFLTEVGYRGIVDMDFRWDARDSQYKLLDVNPRLGSTFRLFVSEDGLDVTRACYLDLTGQRTFPARAADGRKWIVEDFDVVAAIRHFRDGNLKLRKWLKSLSGIRESAFLALDDLLPLLPMLRADLVEFLRRVRPCRIPGLLPDEEGVRL